MYSHYVIIMTKLIHLKQGTLSLSLPLPHLHLLVLGVQRLLQLLARHLLLHDRLPQLAKRRHLEPALLDVIILQRNDFFPEL